MKDLRINGRLSRVFVLRENDSRIVYIPVKSLHRVDYTRLTNAEKASADSKDDLLTYLSSHKLDNGINALVQYKDIIEVLILKGDKTGDRLGKPSDPGGAIK